MVILGLNIFNPRDLKEPMRSHTGDMLISLITKLLNSIIWKNYRARAHIATDMIHHVAIFEEGVNHATLLRVPRDGGILHAYSWKKEITHRCCVCHVMAGLFMHIRGRKKSRNVATCASYIIACG